MGVSYTRRQVCEACNRKGWTHKVLRNFALEQDEILKAQWRLILRPRRLGGVFDSRHLLFLDEASRNPRAHRRTHGRGPRGERIKIARPANINMAQRCCIVGSFSIEGFVTTTVLNTTEESVNTDIFMKVLIDDIFPHMNAFPGERSVLCLDNARIHNKDRIYAAAKEIGVIVLFLPPYTPEFSPIELAFNCMRSKCLALYGRDVNSIPLRTQLQYASNCCVTAANACDMFETCGIEVSVADKEWANR